MEPTIIDAIKSVCRKHHDEGFSIFGDENTITDLSTTELSSGESLKFTFEDATTELSSLKAEYDAQEYARNRASAYPAITDQLDEIYHNGIDSWKAVIKVTKDKYPKG